MKDLVQDGKSDPWCLNCVDKKANREKWKVTASERVREELTMEV
jgi:hypothetical protein